jgi:tRNA 5-methylaminomethyl-2-thiouridine biosynthesis bifunctional protein
MESGQSAIDFIVIGAGLAGAACAYALAQRGARVQVLSMGEGASELPVGLMAAHLSAQDLPASQLSRAGVELTLTHCAKLLRQGLDWQSVRVRQRLRDTEAKNDRLRDAARQWPDWFALEGDDIVHLRAAWIKPQRLVQAWLAHPAIRTQSARVGSIQFAGRWQALEPSGQLIAQAPCVILAAGVQTASLASSAGHLLQLGQVDGAVAMGAWRDDAGSQAFNGHGHFVGGIPSDVPPNEAHAQFWLSGSTYEHEQPIEWTPEQVASASLEANRQRLRGLLPPELAQGVDAQFAERAVHSWRGTRCTSPSRLPLARQLAPGLYVCTAMGSRGLSYAALCGETLAQQALASS